MDAFEAIVAQLLRCEGYWVMPRFKVELTKEEKRDIGRHSSPRWEIDIVAYKGATNSVLAVECKSFLNSRGVLFRENRFEPQDTYKLFAYPIIRTTVLNRLQLQLVAETYCPENVTVQLCLATGKIATDEDRIAMHRYFDENNWVLWDDRFVSAKLCGLSATKYEDDIAYVAAKLASNHRNT